MKEFKILAGITEENELYFLEIETAREGQAYFSMSGFTVEPITVEEAEERLEDMYDSGYYKESWKQSVEVGATLLGYYEWLDRVKEEESWEEALDNSLFSEIVDVDGVEYGFLSESCGQHQERELKHYFLDKKTFDLLMLYWDKYHLKNFSPAMPELPEQNINELAIEAIRIINENK